MAIEEELARRLPQDGHLNQNSRPPRVPGVVVSEMATDRRDGSPSQRPGQHPREDGDRPDERALGVSSAEETGNSVEVAPDGHDIVNAQPVTHDTVVVDATKALADTPWGPGEESRYRDWCRCSCGSTANGDPYV